MLLPRRAPIPCMSHGNSAHKVGPYCVPPYICLGCKSHTAPSPIDIFGGAHALTGHQGTLFSARTRSPRRWTTNAPDATVNHVVCLLWRWCFRQPLLQAACFWPSVLLLFALLISVLPAFGLPLRRHPERARTSQNLHGLAARMTNDAAPGLYRGESLERNGLIISSLV